MPNINNKYKPQERNKLVLLVLGGIFAFIIAILMNVIGFKQTLNNNDTDKSGFIEFVFPSISTKEETKIDNNKTSDVIEEKKLILNSMILIKLNNSNWDRIAANLKGFTLDEAGNAYFEDGTTLYCNGKNVDYITFNSNYSEEIIEHVKLGDSFETIKSKLGTPTFNSENSLGYKTQAVYIFFYDNEVCVYPNKKYSNGNLETLILDYYNKTYNGNRTNFVVEVLNSYNDFESEMDGEDVVLNSVLRQISIRLNKDGNIAVTIYNGYNINTEKMKNYVDDNIFEKSNDDSIELKENERIS